MVRAKRERLTIREKLTIREILTGVEYTRERGSNMQAVPEYPHIVFSDVDHYRRALALAEKLGGEELSSFKEAFVRLEGWCARDNGTVEVHSDAMEYSFYFRIYKKDGRCSMDGGVILHDMGPSYSVEMAPKQGIHWTVHT